MPFISRYTNSLIFQKKKRAVSGGNLFGTGANIFTVPSGVSNVQALAVGGGGTGTGPNPGVSGGGGGGGLGWQNFIPVTPGQQLIAYAGWGGNGAIASTTLWGNSVYEEAKGGSSFVATLNATALFCSCNVRNTNVSTTSTTGLYVGQTVVVGQGIGLFQNETTISAITGPTSFTINKKPIKSLFTANVYVTSVIYCSGRGGGYPTGYSGSTDSRNSGYYTLSGGIGGTYTGQGGGNGGNGGSGAVYQGSSQFIGSGGGGGGAGGYTGAGGSGGNSNGSDATNPTAGASSTGGGGGGGSGGKSTGNSSGYLGNRGGHGGGVGIYGLGVNGAGASVEIVQQEGKSGLGGSGGNPANNQATISTTYSGSTLTSGFGSYNVTAGGSPNFSVITSDWVIDGSPSRGQSSRITKTSATAGQINNKYSVGITNGTFTPRYYHSGYVDRNDQPELSDYGGGMAGNSSSVGGRGAVRIIFGPGKSFPSNAPAEE